MGLAMFFMGYEGTSAGLAKRLRQQQWYQKGDEINAQ